MLCLFSAVLVVACSRERAHSPDNSGADKTTQAHPPEPIPKIDVHTHVDPRAAGEALAIFGEQHIAIGLNASGGEPGRGLETSIELAQRTGGRLQPLCNLRLSLVADPRFPEYVRASLTRCKELGGRGLKISKYLGLGLTDAAGALMPVDDPRLDVVFETAGELKLPVLLHSGDPKAFFEPNDAKNERHEELSVHPDWSFHGMSPLGQPWPSWNRLLEQFEARVARHPNTSFVGAHLGNAAEEPDRVARMLRRYPNYVVDTAARVPEFGRHAASRMRRFFMEFQDQVLFGSDLGVGLTGLTLGSGGERPGTREESRVFFERHWLYFESQKSGLANPTPIQGRWTVNAVGLPRAVLEKLYHRNAERVFALSLPARAKP